MTKSTMNIEWFTSLQGANDILAEQAQAPEIKEIDELAKTFKGKVITAEEAIVNLYQILVGRIVAAPTLPVLDQINELSRIVAEFDDIICSWNLVKVLTAFEDVPDFIQTNVQVAKNTSLDNMTRIEYARKAAQITEGILRKRAERKAAADATSRDRLETQITRFEHEDGLLEEAEEQDLNTMGVRQLIANAEKAMSGRAPDMNLAWECFRAAEELCRKLIADNKPSLVRGEIGGLNDRLLRISNYLEMTELNPDVPLFLRRANAKLLEAFRIYTTRPEVAEQLVLDAHSIIDAWENQEREKAEAERQAAHAEEQARLKLERELKRKGIGARKVKSKVRKVKNQAFDKEAAATMVNQHAANNPNFRRAAA